MSIDRRILGAAIALQTLFLVIGIFGQLWLMTGLCLWTRTPWISSALGIIWLTLTLSPLLGLLSFTFERFRLPYLTLVVLTPIFWITVMMLANSRVLICDGP
jgi:hypothetical protein